jgi:energy-coupling factor transporter ATP-binding protein EcfA2
MAKEYPTGQQYLTVISEWSSYGQSGVRVGNAFPIFSLTKGEVVSNPIDEFPNPGGIFLVNRGECRVWDYVVVMPKTNEQYKNKGFRDCYYIAFGVPELYDPVGDQCKVATVLDVPNFDIVRSDNVIRHPPQSVTSVFFIRDDQQRIFGPLKRTQVVMDTMDRIGAIHWAPWGSESGVYEFTLERLTAQGCKLLSYEHPNPPNEVVQRPIRLLAGPIWKVTSLRVHDRMSDSQLAEWYLNQQKMSDIPDHILKTLRTAPEQLKNDSPEVTRRRFVRLMQVFGALEVMQTERQMLARKYLDTDDGKRMIEQRLAREVEQKAKEIEDEVKLQRADLTREQQELAEKLESAKIQHGKQVKALKEELEQLAAKKAAQQESLALLETHLRQGVEQLGERVRDQVPLLAAMGGGRVVLPSNITVSADGPAAVPAAASKPLWSSVTLPEPTKDLAVAVDEPALITRLVEDLRAEGLYFTRDFVANLYVLLKSSALNLTIGPPGYGKSSVVAALARALGHGNALLEIAVRRSWSDDRHLLGFYDSFHGRYDPGPTGLATRLLQAQRDWEGDRRGVYMILLDEFNLSAPEYYFSQLLQVVTRPPEQGRAVRLFDASSLPTFAPDRIDQITINPNVSFWGTINYDETTERLSPRLLDRTGMVFLTPRDVLLGDQTPDAAPAAGTKGVRGREVCGSCVRKAEQCPSDLWEKIEPLLELLGRPTDEWGPRVELSPRVLTAIRRYLANAAGLLPPEKAVDFVFQQRVLPVLRGRGPQFASRVKALEQKLAENGLERSARHVQEAAAIAASQFGDIDFLAY